MTVYYALIHVADNGRHSLVYGDHDLEAVDDRFIKYNIEDALDRDTRGAGYVPDNVDKYKIVTLPADNLLAAYLDRQNAGIDDAARQSSEPTTVGWELETTDEALQAFNEAIAEEVKQANDRIEQRAAAATPAKPIAPSGTLVGTVPSAYPYLDAEGWDAAARHKLQFDTVTAEGIAAIPHVELTANQIRYAGDIGAIHVDRRSIPHRYRFSDVMEYAAARDAGDKPAMVAERHAKARQ